MSAIDVDALLQPVSDENPCGDVLEYDPTFQAMERAAEGKPEQQMGDTVVPAEEPEWKELQSQGLEILGRSKDLRAAVYVARAALRTEGFTGFAAGLALIRGMLETYWDGLHPVLDPDDDNDPTFRMNVLESLASLDATVRAVRSAPLVESRMLGRFSLHDLEIASGEATLPEDFEGEAPTLAGIEAAFMEADLDEIRGTDEAVGRAIEQLAGIDAFLAAQLPPGSQANLESLERSLKAAHKPLTEALARLGEGEEPEGEGASAAGGPGASAPGAINSREDVERTLDKICSFYRSAEPASPVPLLLQRARALVRADFMEIMRELAPAGVDDAERILKSREGEES